MSKFSVIPGREYNEQTRNPATFIFISGFRAHCFAVSRNDEDCAR
jgi:hypothetical protein